MKGCMSTDHGIITIDPEVIAKYAGSVAMECFGIVGMAAINVTDGLVHLLKRASLTRGIQVNISEENHVTLDFHIIVAYGVSISAVTDNLISNVKYRVEEFAGMPVDKINIYIEGVRVID
ncbi:Asp23/Gls24 family envelope stress response protein [Lachnospiraceae bacterium 48-42]|nr:Asp23/Gls24 family envelope stress response protein [Dorea sp.]